MPAKNIDKKEIIHYVYIIQCKDNSLYTGWTTDLHTRLKTHNAGKGAKYTKGRFPVKLVYVERFEDKSQALKREHSIKNMKRSQKLTLIAKHPISFSD